MAQNRKEIYRLPFNHLMMKLHSLSLVLPCYNPTPGWEARLYEHYLRIKENLPATVSRLEVIVVNDGSTTGIDRSGLHWLARNISPFIFLEYPANKGKGYAVRRGVEAAKTEFIIYTDIDFPFETRNLCEMVRRLERGADVVAGRRNPDYFKRLSRQRAAASRIIQTLNSRILGTGSSDAQAGIKGMSRKGRRLMLQTSVNRFLFDTEFIAFAMKKKDIRVEVIELHLGKKAGFSRMGASIFLREFWNFVAISWKLCWYREESTLIEPQTTLEEAILTEPSAAVV